MKRLSIFGNLFFVATASLWLGACSSSSTNNVAPKPTECTPSTIIVDVKQVRSLMAGQWTWLKTVTTQRSGVITQTPTTDGITKQLVFATDGNVEVFENGKSTKKYQYEISYKTAGSTEMEMLFKKSGIILTTDAVYKVEFCNNVMNLTEMSNSLMPVHTYNK